jgi:predicted lipoprotein
MMVDRTPEIGTLLRQKPAAEPIQGIGRHNATKAALDVLRDRMETLRRDQNALRERMAALCPIRRRLGQHRDHWSCGAQ